MKVLLVAALLLAALLLLAFGQNDDLFTYGETDEANRVYGPRDWNQVGCDDLDTCVSVFKTIRLEQGLSAHPHLFLCFRRIERMA